MREVGAAVASGTGHVCVMTVHSAQIFVGVWGCLGESWQKWRFAIKGRKAGSNSLKKDEAGRKVSALGAGLQICKRIE